MNFPTTSYNQKIYNHMSLIKIGVFMNPWAKLYAFFAQKEIKRLTNAETVIAYFHQEKDLNQALLAGDIHLVCTSLCTLPTQLPKGLVITALSGRLSAAYSIIINTASVDTSKDLSVKDKAKVCVDADINKAQLADIRSDFDISVKEQKPIDTLNDLYSKQFEACMIPSASKHLFDIDESQYKVVSISPKEFVPEAGRGVAAFITAEDDKITRRLLKQLHHPEVAAVTNIERQVKRLFKDENIGAYCLRDDNSNYHLWAAALINGRVSRTRLSQSTHFEMAERCKELLLQQS
jgi:porphobilinogen deaminase